MWVRVLLPQVLGAHLAASEDAAPAKLRGESAAAALGFVDLCLAAVRPADEPEQLNLRGYPKWNAGTVALAPEENALVNSAPINCVLCAISTRAPCKTPHIA